MPAAVLLLLGLGFLFEVWGVTALMFWPGSSLKRVFKRRCNEKMVLLILGLESVSPVLLIWFQEVWICRQNNYFQEYKYQYWYINLSIEYQFQEYLLSMRYCKENPVEMADGALRVLQSKFSFGFFDFFMTKLVSRLHQAFASAGWTRFAEFYFQRQNSRGVSCFTSNITSFRFLGIFSIFRVSDSGSSHDKGKKLESICCTPMQLLLLFSVIPGVVRAAVTVLMLPVPAAA